MTDWNALANEYKKEYKDYAPLGRYKAKVEKAEVKKINGKNGENIVINFFFQDSDEYKFPKSAAHWASRNNINSAKWQNAAMLQVLGVSEENARKAIDGIEKDGVSIEQAVKCYQAVYDRACSRHPEVEIEVREQIDYKTGEVRMSDKGYAYTESEFADRSVYSSNKPKTASEIVESVDDLGSEEINIDDIPF